MSLSLLRSLERAPLGAVMRLARFLHALPRREPNERPDAYRARVQMAILRARKRAAASSPPPTLQ